MKKNYIKSSIAVALVFAICAGFATYADEISIVEKYGPAATVAIEKKELPEGTLVYDSPIAATTVDITTANAIKQINIVDPNAAKIGSSPTNLITNPTKEDLANPYANMDIIPSDNATYLPTTLGLTNLVVKNTNATKPAITAPAYALINASTNQIYAAKDQTTKYNPSGLANLMTAYIAASSLSMDAKLKVNSSALHNIDKDASIIALSSKDTITLRDAIAAMFVKGAVDAANVIAENVAGNKTAFVALMNTTATNLGMQNTTFIDPAGISNDNQTTALDMAILMAKVCEKPELLELLSLSTYSLPQVEKRDKLIIYSKNSLLNRESASYNADVKASRMAFTSNSKYCISSLMNYNNNIIIAVVLKSEGSQFSDTKKLLEFAKVAIAE